MWGWLRIVLRVVAVVLIAVGAYLIWMQPTATVVSNSLLTKVTVQVRCSSVLNQWTNNAKPAALLLNGQPLISVPEAQSSCASPATTIKRVSAGLGGAAVVLVVVSLLRRRSLRR
jgi:hypothetical protein